MAAVVFSQVSTPSQLFGPEFRSVGSVGIWPLGSPAVLRGGDRGILLLTGNPITSLAAALRSRRAATLPIAVHQRTGLYATSLYSHGDSQLAIA